MGEYEIRDCELWPLTSSPKKNKMSGFVPEEGSGTPSSQEESLDRSDFMQGEWTTTTPSSVPYVALEGAEETQIRQGLDKHVLKRLPTAMSLASDSEEEPGGLPVDNNNKLASSRYSTAIIFENLKLNTVSEVENG